MAFPWLPVIGGMVLGNFLGDSKKSEPKAPQRMSYEQALGQARNILTPQYEKGRERVLGDVNRNLIGRGFYGQAPGDALRAGTMADMEADFQGQLASAATNLQDRRYAQDYQLYQTQLQQANRVDPFWGAIGQIAGGFAGGPAGETIFNWLIN